MKNLGTLALQKLLILINRALDKRIHEDDEIDNSTIASLFTQAGGTYVGYMSNNGDTPIGTIISIMGTHAPEGYLICDGSEYNITDYPALAEYFNEQFGSPQYFGGNSITSFSVPDLRDQFILGASDDNHPIGTTGGEENHTLTTPELPVHNHSITIHNSTTQYKTGTGTAYPVVNNNTTTVNTANTGNNQPHNNMPPYMAALYCIKAVPMVSNVRYTEDEACVGTWIDGCIIYQITIPISTTGTYTSILSLDEYNIDKIIYATGFVNNQQVGSDSASVYIENGMIRYAGLSPYAQGNGFITIQYTKRNENRNE